MKKQQDVLKLSSSNKITLSEEVREKLNLKKGDRLAYKVTRGFIVFKPIKKEEDADYFHTKEWQDAEAVVDKEIFVGDIAGPFENADELLRALKS